MRLMVASYNNGTGNWNAEAEETNLLSYSIQHEFNRPASALIVLRDSDGTTMQKYNVDANDVYVGPGRVTIEDPTSTDVFDGRIVRARHDSLHHRVYLLAYDWLSQLNERRIDYDMRENLGSNIRESTLASDITASCWPVHTLAGITSLLDRTMNWAPNQWDDCNVVFPNSMAGNQTVGIGPYSDTVVPDADTDIGGFDDLWVDDADFHLVWDLASEETVTYKFRIYVPRSTRLVSISAARFKYLIAGASGVTVCSLYDNAASTWRELKTMTFSYCPGGEKGEIDIPAQYVTPAILTDTDGESTIKFVIPANHAFQLFYLWLEVDVVTTGYGSALPIDFTSTTAIQEDTADLAVTGVGLWEGCPYMISKEIYKHLHTGLGTLITDGDTMVELTCDGTIEHTTGISTQHYQGKTRLEIMQELTDTDKAVFWAALGTVIVTWKSTFNDGAPTALTDASVLEWREGEYDYELMHNEYVIYGTRIGNVQLKSTDSDAVSIAKYKATRTQIVSRPYFLGEYDTVTLADNLITRDTVVDLHLTALMSGLSTLRLGNEVSITSSYLNLTAAKYVVTKWSYDSRQYRTELRLAPRTSNGYVERMLFGEGYRSTVGRAMRIEIDAYLPEPYTKTCDTP